MWNWVCIWSLFYSIVCSLYYSKIGANFNQIKWTHFYSDIEFEENFLIYCNIGPHMKSIAKDFLKNDHKLSCNSITTGHDRPFVSHTVSAGIAFVLFLSIIYVLIYIALKLGSKLSKLLIDCYATLFETKSYEKLNTKKSAMISDLLFNMFIRITIIIERL